jgi:hypothetical protein
MGHVPPKKKELNLKWRALGFFHHSELYAGCAIVASTICFVLAMVRAIIRPVVVPCALTACPATDGFWGAENDDAFAGARA